MRRIWLLLLPLCLSTIALSQTQVISGRVTDADTKEGLPFSNVYIPGTTLGVSTDLDGYYTIELQNPADSIAASALGYDVRIKPIPTAGDSISISFSLGNSDFTLEEIVVIAGENPANIIVRNIIENKDENRIESQNTVQYESYSKVELDLENIDEDLRSKKWMKPFAFVFENIDSTSDEKPFLPVYLNENLADVYYVKGEGDAKEVIKGQRTSGISNQSVVEYIKKIHQKFSIYDNWIYVLEKPLASPFSDAGLFYYEYYIQDSAYINNNWSYKLKFKPKRKQENTFFGDFWVTDSTFAIQRVNMRMSPDVNINLVSRVIIYQEFDTLQNIFVPFKQKMIVDFTAAEGTPGMIGRRTETFKDFVLNKPDTKKRFSESDPDYTLEEIEQNDESYWQSVRHEPLKATEEGIYAMVDSIKNVPIYKTYVQILETIFTGYFEFGNVEIGPYFSVYSNNPVEGNRVRLGLRTTPGFNKQLRIGGFLAYGFRDQDFKYGADLQWRISKKPRVLLGAAYKKDISLNSESSETFVEGDLFSGTFRRNILQKLISVEEAKIFYERSWKKGFSNRLTLLNRNMDPYGALTPDGAGFNYGYLDGPNDIPANIDTTINTTELIFKTRFAPGENIIDGNYNQVSFGSTKPIIELQYTLGVEGVFGSDYNYHKLDLYFRHYVNIPPIGWLSYRFKAGKTFGTVPFLLAEVHAGNEGFVSNRGTFNTLNRYEFASDTYFMMLLEHHFDGYLFNKIPWVRKLDLRAVVNFKAVIGSLSDANQAANLNYVDDFTGTEVPPFQTYLGFTTPSRRPFMEAGVGIENIFKVFRVEAMWRLSYLNNPEIPKFNIMVGTAFYF
ncbi:MAG: DUF5686 family protein [Bacteroidota bacterium]